MTGQRGPADEFFYAQITKEPAACWGNLAALPKALQLAPAACRKVNLQNLSSKTFTRKQYLGVGEKGKDAFVPIVSGMQECMLLGAAEAVTDCVVAYFFSSGAMVRSRATLFNFVLHSPVIPPLTHRRLPTCFLTHTWVSLKFSDSKERKWCNAESYHFLVQDCYFRSALCASGMRLREDVAFYKGSDGVV